MIFFAASILRYAKKRLLRMLAPKKWQLGLNSIPLIVIWLNYGWRGHSLSPTKLAIKVFCPAVMKSTVTRVSSSLGVMARITPGPKAVCSTSMPSVKMSGAAVVDARGLGSGI
jgi:hypothetical protein